MLMGLFDFVLTLLNIVFGILYKVLGFVFSLPLWFLVITNIMGTLGFFGIVGLIIYNRKNVKNV